jgi:hypothetical protein
MPEVPSASLLENRYQSIMIVGGYKTGKTYSLVTLMEHLDLHNPYGSKNLYLFDMDGDGGESLISALEKRGHRDWIKRPEDGGRLKVFRYIERNRTMLAQARPARSMDPFMNFCNDLNSVVNMYETINNETRWKDPKIGPGAICVDSTTSYSEMVFDYVLVKRGKELGGSREQGPDTDIDAPKKYVEPGDWVSLQEKVVDMVKTLKAMPCHRIVTFHEELVQEIIAGTLTMEKGKPNPVDPKGTGKIFSLPLLSGKLQSSIGKNFSTILYTRYRAHSDLSKAYVWRVRPSEMEHIAGAGSRSKQDLPDEISQNFCTLLD